VQQSFKEVQTDAYKSLPLSQWPADLSFQGSLLAASANDLVNRHQDNAQIKHYIYANNKVGAAS
jgi:hypothetical protein